MYGVPWLHQALATKYSEIALLIGYQHAFTHIVLNIKQNLQAFILYGSKCSNSSLIYSPINNCKTLKTIIEIKD